MDLTIVIVNWNGGDLLTRCLASIRAHAGSGRVGVLVVDNDSSDGSREAAAAAFPEFRVINSGSNLGFGRANNLARGLVDTPVVLFLNPDTELMEGTLERAARCLQERPDVGAVGCRMLDAHGRVQELGLQWPTTPATALFELLFVSERSRRLLRRWLPLVDPMRSGFVRKLYGGFLMARREVLDGAGWFDERYFMYAEDADLSRTILALGLKLYYCSEAVIMHAGGGTTAHAPSAFSVLMKQESIRQMIEKYQGSRAAARYRAVVCCGALVRLAAGRLASLAAALKADRAAASRWQASCFKQRQLVLWSRGLKKAAVPTARPADAQPDPAQ
jgi:hypothetical protein